MSLVHLFVVCASVPASLPLKALKGRDRTWLSSRSRWKVRASGTSPAEIFKKNSARSSARGCLMDVPVALWSCNRDRPCRLQEGYRREIARKEFRAGQPVLLSYLYVLCTYRALLLFLCTATCNRNQHPRGSTMVVSPCMGCVGQP